MHGPWQFASHRFHLASSWGTVDSPRSRVRNLLVHLLQQDIPQPVFHIHEVPFQHFGKELAKETLLAFHGERPTGFLWQVPSQNAEKGPHVYGRQAGECPIAANAPKGS